MMDTIVMVCMANDYAILIHCTVIVLNIIMLQISMSAKTTLIVNNCVLMNEGHFTVTAWLDMS